MKKALWFLLLIVALAACGGGGSDPSAGDGSGDGSGGETQDPADDGGYAAAPDTDFVHVYNIVDIYDPFDLSEDELITLDDGSVWEVTLYDYRISLWIDYQDVVVCGLDMVNLDREDNVKVSWSGGPSAETCPTYTISDILEDGELLKLSDGSYWRISSYDAFDTEYWYTGTDDIVITDDYKLVNVDQAEVVDGTRLN